MAKVVVSRFSHPLLEGPQADAIKERLVKDHAQIMEVSKVYKDTYDMMTNLKKNGQEMSPSAQRLSANLQLILQEYREKSLMAVSVHDINGETHAAISKADLDVTEEYLKAACADVVLKSMPQPKAQIAEPKAKVGILEAFLQLCKEYLSKIESPCKKAGEDGFHTRASARTSEQI